MNFGKLQETEVEPLFKAFTALLYAIPMTDEFSGYTARRHRADPLVSEVEGMSVDQGERISGRHLKDIDMQVLTAISSRRHTERQFEQFNIPNAGCVAIALHRSMVSFRQKNDKISPDDPSPATSSHNTSDGACDYTSS